MTSSTFKLIAKKELTRVIADFTVHEKAVAQPIDIKLRETARSKVVEVAKANGIERKQTYAQKGQLLGYKAGLGYSAFFAHARQNKRMCKVIKRQPPVLRTAERPVLKGPRTAMTNLDGASSLAGL